MSFQALLSNHTPFAADKVVLVDPEGQEAVLVVLAATFEQGPRGAMIPVEAPPPVLLADIYAGDPGVSCMLAENELALGKPFLDVLLVGTAYAPGGRPVERAEVEMHVGSITKSLLVSGHRAWAAGGPTRPIPFTEMPLRYDRAFGGVSPRTGIAHPENPLGLGFDGAEAGDGSPGSVPNIEHPDALMTGPRDRPPVAGMGPIVRWWPQRAAFAGTYDEPWKNERWPLLPKDFDPRFNQAAPLDQQTRSLVGGENVTLVNLTRDGVWRFRLPRLRVPLQLVYDEGSASETLRWDTLMIEPDMRRVRLTARFALTTVRGNALREIVLGSMTRGWSRAVEVRKRYLDFRGTGGADPTVPLFD